MNGDENTPTEPTTASPTPDTAPAAEAAKPEASAEAAKPEASAEVPKPEASAEAAKPEASTEAPKAEPQPEAAKAEPQATPVGGIADALRRAFTDYLDESGAREQYGNEVNIDLDFLKDHAGPMFSSMFQQLTSSIIPKDLKVGVPINPATGQAGEKPVAVNFDLGGILTSFFSQKKQAAANDSAAEAAKPAADAAKPAAETAEAAPASTPDAE